MTSPDTMPVPQTAAESIAQCREQGLAEPEKVARESWPELFSEHSKPTPGVAEIPLTKGAVALIDERDLPLVANVKWCLCNGYAVRSVRQPSGKTKHFRMHRVIMDAPDDMEVDHIDGDRLNNRRSNLRLCTSEQNTHNRPKHNTGGSRIYKGVRKRNNRYVAEICVARKNISLGSFLTAEDAAHAYDCAAIKYHGEFANLNGVSGKPSPRALQSQATAILAETGLTPRELQKQRDELLAALKAIVCPDGGFYCTADVQRKASAAIASGEGGAK